MNIPANPYPNSYMSNGGLIIAAIAGLLFGLVVFCAIRYFGTLIDDPAMVQTVLRCSAV